MWRAAVGLVSLVPEGSVPDKDMGPMSPQLIERCLTKTASTPLTHNSMGRAGPVTYLSAHLVREATRVLTLANQ